METHWEMWKWCVLFWVQISDCHGGAKLGFILEVIHQCSYSELYFLWMYPPLLTENNYAFLPGFEGIASIWTTIHSLSQTSISLVQDLLELVTAHVHFVAELSKKCKSSLSLLRCICNYRILHQLLVKYDVATKRKISKFVDDLKQVGNVSLEKPPI